MVGFACAIQLFVSPPFSSLSKMANRVISGFSQVNRYIFYASLMLCPAQALSGVDTRWPSNIGFLAYNAYQQYLWYRGVKAHDLHALSLVPIHQNMVSTITYAGGIPAGDNLVVTVQCLGVIALITSSTYTMWLSWMTNLQEGYGVYKFSLLGERTLSESWRYFNCLWGIWNTMEATFMICSAIWLSIRLIRTRKDPNIEHRGGCFERMLKVLWGALCIVILVGPFVYWMERIVKLNNIVSETDTISIYLFAAQVSIMVIGSVHEICKSRGRGHPPAGQTYPPIMMV
ncbi:hypothetical protein FA13DRAFT_1690742 [Coprinellus micaceus]|uniref:Uncharacterized protein n=1 Tax=Coprinellus micaceus TaxID=71717 RepID=A0A4Y7T2E5_COPMI|nr:hypothetical protein FA13DRAFT_1690742 [Coprinellus micaceus]